MMVIAVGWIGAGAQSLQRAEGDQGRHAPGQTAEDRAERRTAPTPISMIGLRPTWSENLREDRYRHGLGQQKDREQPGELGETAEIVDDRGDCSGQDGRVDGDQTDAEHHREQDRSALGAKTYRSREIVCCSADWAMSRGNPSRRSRIPVRAEMCSV